MRSKIEQIEENRLCVLFPDLAGVMDEGGYYISGVELVGQEVQVTLMNGKKEVLKMSMGASAIEGTPFMLAYVPEADANTF